MPKTQFRQARLNQPKLCHAKLTAEPRGLAAAAKHKPASSTSTGTSTTSSSLLLPLALPLLAPALFLGATCRYSLHEVDSERVQGFVARVIPQVVAAVL